MLESKEFKLALIIVCIVLTLLLIASSLTLNSDIDKADRNIASMEEHIKSLQNELVIEKLNNELERLEFEGIYMTLRTENEQLQHRLAENANAVVVVEDTNISTINDYEMELLAKVVQAEVGDYDYECRVNVAVCILDRVKDEEFPNSIPAVIYQPGAFETVTNNSYNEKQVTELTRKACIEAVYESHAKTDDLVLWFYNPALVKSTFHESQRFLFKDTSNHHFYGRDN